uniref:Uncharacterized protein n=1 Tax=viral metagenome TaxID=1070528 RepID=A0A6C0HDT2_9ZZZZ
MTTNAIIPMTIVNRIIRDAAVLNRDKKYFQLRFNKLTQTWETRWFFRTSYQKTKKFASIIRCLKYKKCNPPEVSYFLVEPCIEPQVTKDSFYQETVEEVDAFSKKLRWGLKYEFPEKTKTYKHRDEETFKYTYIHFEDGQGRYNSAFIEENSCEDSLLGDYCSPMFHRAYVSIHNTIFPFFKEPSFQEKFYPWNKETNSQEKPTIQYCSIPYLNKQRGMRVKTDGYSEYSFKYFDEDKEQWSYESFTPYERRQLVLFYESNCYGNYDDD